MTGEYSTTVITRSEALELMESAPLTCLMDNGHYLLVITEAPYKVLNPEKAIHTPYVLITSIRTYIEQVHFVYFLDREEVSPSDSMGYFSLNDKAKENLLALINKAVPTLNIYDIDAREIHPEDATTDKEAAESPCIGRFHFNPACGNVYIRQGVVLYRIANYRDFTKDEKESAQLATIKDFSQAPRNVPMVAFLEQRLNAHWVECRSALKETRNGLIAHYRLRNGIDVRHRFDPDEMIEARLPLVNYDGRQDHVDVFCHFQRNDNGYQLVGYEKYPIENAEIRIRDCDSYERRFTLHNIILEVCWKAHSFRRCIQRLLRAKP